MKGGVALPTERYRIARRPPAGAGITGGTSSGGGAQPALLGRATAPAGRAPTACGANAVRRFESARRCGSARGRPAGRGGRRCRIRAFNDPRDLANNIVGASPTATKVAAPPPRAGGRRAAQAPRSSAPRSRTRPAARAGAPGRRVPAPARHVVGHVPGHATSSEAGSSSSGSVAGQVTARSAAGRLRSTSSACRCGVGPIAESRSRRSSAAAPRGTCGLRAVPPGGALGVRHSGGSECWARVLGSEASRVGSSVPVVAGLPAVCIAPVRASSSRWRAGMTSRRWRGRAEGKGLRPIHWGGGPARWRGRAEARGMRPIHWAGAGPARWTGQAEGTGLAVRWAGGGSARWIGTAAGRPLSCAGDRKRRAIGGPLEVARTATGRRAWSGCR